MALLPSPRFRPQEESPDPARTLEALATLLVTLLVVGVLYFAREILVPIAIAVILSFVLSPPIRVLRRIGVGKKIAVGIVVLVSFLTAVGLGAILARQISEIAADAPRYQAIVTQKVDKAKQFAEHSLVLSKLNTVIADVTQSQVEARKQAPKPAIFPPRSDRSGEGLKAKKTSGPVPVEIISPPPGVLTILQSAAGSAASPLAEAAFVAIFIVFLLMQREDLRNRFIRLMGSSDLQRTTLALTDAARRLSRYFLAQVLLNAAFGVLVGLVMTLIGVPSAVLWGIVAIFMRFIPYVGSFGAALFPTVMAAAASPGWAMALETALLFAIAEIITGQIIEPFVYGRNTGISPIAVVASATFWTWLWGPIGLVLSTPLTVCLVVMGRHVERMAFLDILLGDAPPLTEIENFYQRMLAGDPSEIVDLADSFLAEHSLLDYCDQVAMKALLMAQGDVRRGVLDEKRQLRIRDTMRDLAEDLADQDGDPLVKVDTEDPPASIGDTDYGRDDEHPDAEACIPHPKRIAAAWTREAAVVCIAGRSALDEAAAHLLADLLKEKGIAAQVEPPERLVGNHLDDLAATHPLLVVLSFFDAGSSIAQARFAVRRLRRHLPDVPLVPAFWSDQADEAQIRKLSEDVRCSSAVASLPQAMKLCLDRASGEHLSDAAE